MSPRDLALELLRHRFRSDVGGSAHLDGLAAFQRVAVPRLERAIARYGGAVLADSVGLGKTHVGAAVVRRAVARGEHVALVVPTSLRRQWQRALSGATGVVTATHAQLSRGGRPALERATLVVVDEAHAFRNPRTQRYAALARLTAGRRSLLITATPVNNSLRDLYWLLRLFAFDDAFAAIGVSDLASCVRETERTGRYASLAAVLAEVAVRRTREDVTLGGTADQLSSYAGAPRSTLRLRFPARAPPVEIRYEVLVPLQRELLECVERLELAPWSALGLPASALLIRLVLLKRLESSRAAFVASAGRLLRTLRAFGDALAAGHLLTPAERRVRALGDADQLALDALVLQPVPPSLDTAALRRSAETDRARLEGVLRHIASAPPDPKLQRLRSLLGEELSGRPVLVFTEFRDTARAIWHELHTRLPVALIHGGGAWLGRTPASRRLVVERFAPSANGAPVPPPRERPLVLVATDVLAEGLNLQDAADLVSYDLPWNPVRLLQRMGRIDRLGSRHAIVRGYYFSPDHELEAMLRLLRRLHAKLAAIRGSVGEEGAVLVGGAGAGRRRPSREVPADRLFEADERLRKLLLEEEAAGADPLAGLPLAHELPAEFPAGPKVAPIADAPPGFEVSSAVPPVLELSGPVGPGGAGTLLFFEYRGRQRAVWVGQRVFEDVPAAAGLLERVLDCPDCSGCVADREARVLISRARGFLVRPPPLPRRRPHVDVLRRRLLELLGSRPGGATEGECRQVEGLRTALRQPLTVGQELALRRVPGRGPLDSLVQAIGGALAQAAALQRPRPAASPEGSAPRFLGGFRVLPGRPRPRLTGVRDSRYCSGLDDPA